MKRNRAFFLLPLVGVVLVLLIAVLWDPSPSPRDSIFGDDDSGAPQQEKGEPIETPSDALNRQLSRLEAAPMESSESPVAQPPSVDSGSGAESALSANLSALARASLSDSPPDLKTLDATLQEIANSLSIVPGTAKYDEAGRLVSIAVEFAGTSTSGTLEFEDDRASLSLHLPSEQPEVFPLANVRVSVPLDAQASTSRGLSMEHYPNTHRRADSIIVDGEMLTCGWTYSVSDGRTALRRTVARAVGGGEGWNIGRVPEGEGEPPETAGAYLTPFDQVSGKIQSELAKLEE